MTYQESNNMDFDLHFGLDEWMCHRCFKAISPGRPPILNLNTCCCGEAGLAYRQTGHLVEIQNISFLHSSATSAPPHGSSVETPPDSVSLTLEGPEASFPDNHFLPFAPATGLAEAHHTHSASLNALEDQHSYSLRRYLTSFPELSQQDTLRLVQDTYFPRPNPRPSWDQSMRGWLGRNSTSRSLRSSSLKSSASGWSSLGIDPVSGSGEWIQGEEAQYSWPTIIGEDSTNNEDRAARHAVLQDHEEHEEPIAQRNLTLNLKSSVPENKKDQSSLSSESKEGFPTSSEANAIRRKRIELHELSLAKEERQGDPKLAALRGEYGERKTVEVHQLNAIEDEGRQESLELANLQVGPSSHRIEEGRQNQHLRTGKPELAFLASSSLLGVASGIVTPLIAAGISSMREGTKVEVNLAPDMAGCPSAENRSTDSSIEESVCDDESMCSQSDCSTGVADSLVETSDELPIPYGERLLVPILDTAKQAIVDQLMQEVWTIFDRNWTGNFTACTGSEPTSSTSSYGREASASTHKPTKKRQRREEGDGNSSGGDNGNAPKQPTPNYTPPDGTEKRLELSCPFRKRNPRKYRIPKFKSCALSHWDSVGRVKEHIYRRHRVPIHCIRCWMLFENQELLVTHSREANMCEVQPKQVLDGITPETEKLLRSRKKEYKGQSEPELWRKIYRILFPNEIVPSPYFEAIRDEAADESDAQERANYDAYCRRELPRLVRSHLESAVDLQLQSLESALRSRLDDIIRDCLDQISANYESLRTVATAPVVDVSETAPSAPIPIRIAESQHEHEQNTAMENLSELQSTFSCFTSLDQYPYPQTPEESGLQYGYSQPIDMSERSLSYNDGDNIRLDATANTGCFCLVGLCECPR